jgi:sRNA-binding carbon storage regulator CsrA
MINIRNMPTTYKAQIQKVNELRPVINAIKETEVFRKEWLKDLYPQEQNQSSKKVDYRALALPYLSKELNDVVQQQLS